MISLMMTATLLGAQQPDCSDTVVQPEMNRCAYSEYRRADAELNTVWRQLIATVRSEGGEPSERGQAEARLRAAQHAWIAFRDAECQVQGLGAVGGSMEPMLVSFCLADLTRARTAQLRARLAIEEP